MEQRIELIFRLGICGFDTEVARLYLVLSVARDSRDVLLFPPNMIRTDFCYFGDTPDLPDAKPVVYP
jgi:hypothetical protein